MAFKIKLDKKKENKNPSKNDKKIKEILDVVIETKPEKFPKKNKKVEVFSKEDFTTEEIEDLLIENEIKKENKKIIEELSIDLDNLKNVAEKNNMREINEYFYRMFNQDKTPKPTGVLTNEMKENEILKCKYNIIYWLENYCKVQAPGGYVSILLNDKLKTVALLLQASCITEFQSSRQSSKTTLMLAILAWYFNFWENTSTLTLNLSTSANKKNLSFIKQVLQQQPDWMQMWNPKKDINNVNDICSALNSKIGGIVISKSEPEETGRGFTGALYMDEIAYLKNISVAYGAVTFTYNTYSKIAREIRTPAPFAITTTPADLSSEAGRFFFDLWENAYEISYEEIKDKLPWEIYDYVQEVTEHKGLVKVFQRWYEFPGRVTNKELINPNNPDNIIAMLEDENVDYKVLKEYDLGAATWLQETRTTCNFLKSKLRKDVYCKFVNSNGQSIFDEEVFENIKMRMPIKRINGLPETKDTFNLYEEVDLSSGKYILVVDSAFSLSGDYLSILLFDIDNLVLVGHGRYRLGKVKKIGVLVEYLHQQYFKNAVIVVERNNIGISVVEYLEDTKCKNKLYWYKETKKSDGQIERAYGFLTSKDTRPKMISLLLDYVNNNPDKVFCEVLIKELQLLEERNGKVQAASNSHDDTTIALCIALYVCEYELNTVFRLMKDFVKYQMDLMNVLVMNESKAGTGDSSIKKLKTYSDKKFYKQELEEIRDYGESSINPLAEFRGELGVTDLFTLMNNF